MNSRTLRYIGKRLERVTLDLHAFSSPDPEAMQARDIGAQRASEAMKHSMVAEIASSRGERQRAARSWRSFREYLRRAETLLQVARVFDHIQGKAPLIPEESPHTGKTRYRCSWCGKIAFFSEEKAKAAAESIFSSRGVRMRWHKGRWKKQYGEKRGRPCGWWHLHRTERQKQEDRTRREERKNRNAR